MDFTGALLDDRPVEKKVDDIKLSDIVATANAVNWTVKSEIRRFPELNQNQSFMCGGNSLAKSLGVAYSTVYGSYVPFSRTDIYQRRNNKPTAGMALYDMFDIASKGVTLEALTPKEIFTDHDADTLVIENFKRKVGEVFAISGAVYIESDIDTIASVIQTTGKAPILLTYFLSSEYSRETPIITDNTLTVNDDRAIRHYIVAVDFSLVNGIKTLHCEDSAHFGGFSRRNITSNWVAKRVTKVAYPMNFKFTVGGIEKPKYDGSIISVQKCLRFEGLFPNNVSLIESIGPLTKKAIMAFQLKNGIQQTGTLGPVTRAKLLSLYP